MVVVVVVVVVVDVVVEADVEVEVEVEADGRIRGRDVGVGVGVAWMRQMQSWWRRVVVVPSVLGERVGGEGGAVRRACSVRRMGAVACVRACTTPHFDHGTLPFLVLDMLIFYTAIAMKASAPFPTKSQRCPI